MSESTFLWPEEGDLLFSFGPDAEEAYLNHFHSGFGTYVSAYKDAADNLVQNTISNRFDRDAVIYPVVFLYRHYLELMLKWIISSGCALLGEEASKRNCHHRLDDLWRESKRIIAIVFPNEDDRAAEVVGENINGFMKIDPGSFAFRYPTTRDGEISLPDLEYIDVKNLYVVMKKISNYLNGSLSGIMEAKHLE